MIARFVLVTAPNGAAGRVDLILDDGVTAIPGIGVHLFNLSRNDPHSISFPPGCPLSKDEQVLAVTRLLPHLRLLTRGRVVPLAAEIAL